MNQASYAHMNNKRKKKDMAFPKGMQTLGDKQTCREKHRQAKIRNIQNWYPCSLNIF
jgi:hypothetical protein